MYSVTREFHFSYGHRLLGYPGKCQNLHGHNALVRVSLAFDSLDENNMALDFTRIKDEVGTWLDGQFDHRTVLCERDPLVPILLEAGEPIVCFKENPTSESFARYIFKGVQELGLPVMEVEFRENERSSAVYWENEDLDEDDFPEEVS